VDCCLTWSLALIDLRARHTRPELQDQLGKGSLADQLDEVETIPHRSAEASPAAAPKGRLHHLG
ncbi:hypothetical protein ACFYML_35450, partial [Micromonospora sp. NPDC007230]